MHLLIHRRRRRKSMTDRRDGDDDDGAFGDGGGARGGGWKYSKSRHFIIFRGGEEVNNTRRGTNGDGCKCPREKKKKGPPIKQSQCAFVLNYQNGTLCHRTTTEGGGNLYFGALKEIRTIAPREIRKLHCRCCFWGHGISKRIESNWTGDGFVFRENPPWNSILQRVTWRFVSRESLVVVELKALLVLFASVGFSIFPTPNRTSFLSSFSRTKIIIIIVIESSSSWMSVRPQFYVLSTAPRRSGSPRNEINTRCTYFLSMYKSERATRYLPPSAAAAKEQQ